MLTGDKGHDVFTQVRALSMEVKPYSCLIDIDDMGSTRVDLPRDQGGVGFYLHREGPNLGRNIVSLVSCYHPPRRTVRDPLPEIRRF